MKIIWSKEAKFNFYNIQNYLELYWTPLAAKKFITDVLHVNSLLEKNPQLGKYKANLECREIVISKHITLYYQTKDDHIRLISFWSNRQHPPEVHNL